MSMQYCFFCDKSIDTDYQPDHFNDAGKCISPTVGIDYFGREFYIGVIPDYGSNDPVECKYCETVLKPGDTAVIDHNAHFGPDWFCSYDCVNEKTTEWDRVADAQGKYYRELRAMGRHPDDLRNDQYKYK